MKTTPRAGGAALSALTLVASTIVLADSAGARSNPTSTSTASTAITTSTVTGYQPSGPSPYTVNATVSVGTSTPAQGARLRVSGTRFKPNESVRVKIDVRSHEQFRKNALKRTLKVVRANASGGFKTRVQLPPRAKCTHWIVARGKASKRVATTKITIGRCD